MAKKQMKARMTVRQRRFVAEYLIDLNGAQAAIRAGYGVKGAGQKAWQLLNWRPQIAEAVREAMKARETRTMITADKVLQEIARIAFADIRGLLQSGPDGIRPKPIESLTAAEAAAIAELWTTEKGMRLRLHDKRAALLDIARHLGLIGKQAQSPPGLRDKDELPAREILRRKLAQLAGERKA
ncbi:MAG TPA: terminase small subunit [Stellaceae bacterium]